MLSREVRPRRAHSNAASAGSTFAAVALSSFPRSSSSLPLATGWAQNWASLLLESMQRWIERSLIDLQHLPGHLPDPLRNGPAVDRLERNRLQDQKVHCSLHQVRRFTHNSSPV